MTIVFLSVIDFIVLVVGCIILITAAQAHCDIDPIRQLLKGDMDSMDEQCELFITSLYFRKS